jgi:hypothetical protein
MKKITLHAGSLLVTLVLVAGFAFAQPAQKVSVPFKFTAGSSTLPAGTYYFATQASATRMEVRDAGQKVVSMIPVITRLAKSGKSAASASARLVFDTVGEERYLSEVWMAGADGFLVRATAEKHEHAVVPPEM